MSKRYLIISKQQKPTVFDYVNDGYLFLNKDNCQKPIDWQMSFPNLDEKERVTLYSANCQKIRMQYLRRIDQRYMNLLDLLNYCKNGREFPVIDSANTHEFLLGSENTSLNGVFLADFISRHIPDSSIELINNFELQQDRLRDFLEAGADAVIISTTFLTTLKLNDILDRIKELNPDIPIIAGGPGLSNLKSHFVNTLTEDNIDILHILKKIDTIIVASTGENTLIEVLAGNDRKTINNIAWVDPSNGELIFNPKSSGTGYPIIEENLNWSATKPEFLNTVVAMISSIGCPYRCRFCNYWQLHPKVHLKKIEVLEAELQEINRVGVVKHIQFVDDNLAITSKRLEDVCQMIIRNDFNFSWSCYARANKITPDNAVLLKKANCVLVSMGIESGNDVILKNMDKKNDVKTSLRAIELLESNGVPVWGNFVVGFPGETKQTIQDTINLINNSGLSFYEAYPFFYAPFFTDDKLKNEYQLEGTGYCWRHNTMNSYEAAQGVTEIFKSVNAFTDSLNLWDNYALLVAQGYSLKKVKQLFELNDKIGKLYLNDSFSGSQKENEINICLNKVESLLAQ